MDTEIGENIELDIDKWMDELEDERYELCKHMAPRRKKPIVCAHWLRSLCHKNEYTCDELHVFDPELLPICRFFLKGCCTNGDCKFRHPVSEQSDLYCVAYARGFCPRGAKCDERHIQHSEQERRNIGRHVIAAARTHKRARLRAEKYQ